MFVDKKANMLTQFLTVAALATSVLSHGDHESQIPIAGPHKALWYNTLPGDGGTQVRNELNLYPVYASQKKSNMAWGGNKKVV